MLDYLAFLAEAGTGQPALIGAALARPTSAVPLEHRDTFEHSHPEGADEQERQADDVRCDREWQ